MLKAIQLGDPVEHRGAVIAPLFPRQTPCAEYLTLEEAIPLGFRVAEVDASGSVPELLVENPLDSAVLAYDGEELVGAKQNRILNLSVLVPARSETRIPVSCVEQGRWRSQSSSMSVSPQTAFARLRARKAEQLAVAPMEAGRAQGAVWDEIAAKSERHGVDSPTRSHSDLYERFERDLEALREAFPLQAGQAGAVFAAGGEVTLDYVSRPEGFTRLYPKLLRGYLLDAVERLDEEPGTVDGFLERLEAAAATRRPSVALGEDVRLSGDRVVGSGLELDGELIQLCGFTSEGDGPGTRVERPSRRRRLWRGA
jgi:hypothetical protein